MNILKHSIHKAIYDLCCEIEKLPASEQQTKVVVMASNLQPKAESLVDALRDSITTYRNDSQKVLTTREEEHMEALRCVAEVD